MILATCVVVDESKCLDVPIFEFSIILRTHSNARTLSLEGPAVLQMKIDVRSMNNVVAALAAMMTDFVTTLKRAASIIQKEMTMNLAVFKRKIDPRSMRQATMITASCPHMRRPPM